MAPASTTYFIVPVTLRATLRRWSARREWRGRRAPGRTTHSIVQVTLRANFSCDELLRLARCDRPWWTGGANVRSRRRRRRHGRAHRRGAVAGARRRPCRRRRARRGARRSARYAGYLWTAATDELLAEADPDGDPALRRTLVAGYAARRGVRLLALDVPLGDEVVLLRYGRGRRIDTGPDLGACAEVVTDARGEIPLLRRDGTRRWSTAARCAASTCAPPTAPDDAMPRRTLLATAAATRATGS